MDQQTILSEIRRQNDLRAFSYMTEAWQNTLRYLCYIQLAQLLKSDERPNNAVLSDFIAMRDAAATPDSAERELRFDYLNLLLVSTDLLKGRAAFVPQIAEFVRELTDTESELFDYNLISVEGLFTYSQSVLLFKGNEIQQCLQNIGNPDTYLSLSPLLIDQSVFSEKPTQTPEIYYFTGQTPGARQYEYAQYKNELPLGAAAPASNKTLRVKSENSAQPKLNDLYEQLETVFRPFRK